MARLFKIMKLVEELEKLGVNIPPEMKRQIQAIADDEAANANNEYKSAVKAGVERIIPAGSKDYEDGNNYNKEKLTITLNGEVINKDSSIETLIEFIRKVDYDLVNSLDIIYIVPGTDWVYKLLKKGTESSYYAPATKGWYVLSKCSVQDKEKMVKQIIDELDLDAKVDVVPK